METLLGITLLAMLVEGTITYLFGTAPETQPSRKWIPYVSLAFGIVAAVAFQVDIMAMVGLVSPYPFVSFIASGLIIGRGSNYVNDLIGKLRK